jgi:hypothetical protein
MCSFQGAVDFFVQGRPFMLLKSDCSLSIRSEIVHGTAMSNHAPLHSFEIIFYSIASLLAVIGLAWYLFR